MKKSLVKIVLAAALSVLMILSLTAVGVFVFAENSAIIPAQGYIGETYEIPSVIDVDGTNVKVTAKITDPDGKTYIATELKLLQIGRYTIEYLSGNKTVKTQYCVTVRRPSDLFSVNNYARIIGASEYKYTASPKISGLKFNVFNGAQINFEREIDMTSRTKNDVLSSVIIEPSSLYNRDFGQIILTFSDVEDPSVKITVVASHGNLDTVSGGGKAYVRASGNGQTSGGYEYLGGQRTFNTTDIYGSPAPFSFEASVQNNDYSRFEYAFRLCYDSAENALYLTNGLDNFYGSPYLIVDFDDTSTFGTNLWSGFPSGKAKMSITFDKFVNSQGSVIVEQVDGIDMSRESLPDTESPVISVDFNGEIKAPNSLVGASYKVFNASAYEYYDLNVPVTYDVYYKNTVTNNRYDVAVKDGAFVTDKVGEYQIVYKAVDKSGNQSTQTVTLYCVGALDDVSIEGAPEKIEAQVFDCITLVSADEIRCFGGSGNFTKTLAVVDCNGNTVDLSNNSFVPDKVGVYEARYTARDFLGNVCTSITYIDVKPSGKPVFLGQISLPESFVVGFTYEFPPISAKVCNGNVVTDAAVDYYIGGQKITDGKFTVHSGAADLVAECRAYAYSSQTEYSSLQKTVKVIDGSNGKDQEKYFCNFDGNVTSVLQQDGVLLNVANDGQVFFANKLSHGQFSVNFGYLKGKVNFSTMSVTLTDAVNSTQTLTFRLTFNSAGITVATNGLPSAPFAVKEDAENVYFAIGYDNERRRLSDVNGDDLCVITHYDDSTPFNGFTNGVYLDMRFEGVKIASEISVNNVNNQPFGYKRSLDDKIGDTVAPQIVIDGVFNRRFNLGDTITVFKAYAFDVLNQVSSLTLTVTDPDNNVILGNVVPDKDYTLTLDKIGRYRIVYTAADSLGNSRGAVAGTTVNVVDVIEPTLDVNFDFKQVYKTGSVIKLPDFTVTDNTDNVYCDVLLQLPSNEIRLLIHSENGAITSYLLSSDTTYPNSFKVSENSFKLEHAGKYVITYVAYDDGFNYVRKTVEIIAVD